MGSPERGTVTFAPAAKTKPQAPRKPIKEKQSEVPATSARQEDAIPDGGEAPVTVDVAIKEKDSLSDSTLSAYAPVQLPPAQAKSVRLAMKASSGELCDLRINAFDEQVREAVRRLAKCRKITMKEIVEYAVLYYLECSGVSFDK
ncbi:MAG: hypothetical protein KKB13_21200 [Chloroflexi bacterium]|nr:hypothetical protein [Chloroflexota bacterium]